MERPIEHAGYSSDQLEKYLTYVRLPSAATQPTISITYLTKLIQHHVSTIPFDNLYLHYSTKKIPSLEADAVYAKCVGTHKGGFCVEQNRLFGQVLRGLGFKITQHGARVHSEAGGAVDGGDWYFGWTHMVNLVKLDEGSYLVDVGFGGAAPTKPLLLEEMKTVKGWGEQELRLVRENVEVEGQAERLWVYEQRPSPKDSFTPVYAFATLPFLLQDYAIINHYVATHPASWFTFRIVCMKFIMENEELIGMIILQGNEFYRKTLKGKEELETCESEEQRVKGLQKYFGIILNEEEREGIRTKETMLQG